MKPFRPILLTSVAIITLGLTSHLPAATKQSPANEKLLAATDPYEGLTEAALDEDAGKIQKALESAEAERTVTRKLLAPDAARRFDDLFAALTSAQKKQDNIAVALQAAELYKLLASALDSSALAVPKEVNLLDYSGFRTNALLKMPNPDWNALRDTAAEANGYWAKVRARVGDKKLQARMDKAQQGLATAAAKRDAKLSASSARDNLDLVDELEHYFAK